MRLGRGAENGNQCGVLRKLASQPGQSGRLEPDQSGGVA